MNNTNQNFKNELLPKRSGIISHLGFPLLMLFLCIILTITYSIRFLTLVKGKGVVLKNETRQSGFYIVASLTNEDTLRIRPGQPVRLLLRKYPPGSWGRIMGWVQYTIPSDSNKENVIVKLQNGLVTDRNKPIPFEPGLNGDVIIITKDISLLQRMF